jgi:hypothetical protein
MQAIAVSLPTVAVSAIYCIWNAYRVAQARRECLLRRRVAYLLWVVAGQAGYDPAELP